MALVRRLDFQSLEKDTPHLAVKCTYSVVQTDSGERQLQLDTYGSAKRKIKGKKSQSLRLTEAAVKQLRIILASQFD